MAKRRLPFRYPTAEEIRDLARERGLSVKALCQVAGVQPSSFSRWLSGQNEIQMAAAQRLTDALAGDLPQQKG